MKTIRKIGLLSMAMILALTLGLTALAEEKTEAIPETPVTETAADAAQAKADALNEALTAYGNAKAESRKQKILDSLKQELDAFVAAGKLTQEQADLIYGYYVEQMTLQQNSSTGFGRGGKGGRSMQNGQGMNRDGFGQGGRHGRFGGTTIPADSNTSADPAPVGF